MGLPGKYFPTVVCFWDWLGPDKIAHLLLFGFLAFITLWGYRKKLVDINYPHRKKNIRHYCFNINHVQWTDRNPAEILIY